MKNKPRYNTKKADQNTSLRIQKPVPDAGKKSRFSDIEKVRKITKFIRATEKDLRGKFSWLKHQNTIGMTIFLGSIAGMVLTSVMYISGFLPAWLTIFLNAVFASFLHEIEHDSIHSLYFKDRWQEKTDDVWRLDIQGKYTKPVLQKKNTFVAS